MMGACDSQRGARPPIRTRNRYIISREVERLLVKIQRQGKMDLLIHNLKLVIEAVKNGMDLGKYQALLKQGVYSGEPGKTEELIAQCMPEGRQP